MTKKAGVETFTHKNQKCVIKKTESWWCGYVGIRKDHPYFGMEMDDIPVSVHGGLSYEDKINPATGKKDAGFYFYGFDTVHAGDTPKTTQNRDFCHAETKRLAEQFANLGTGSVKN